METAGSRNLGRTTVGSMVKTFISLTAILAVLVATAAPAFGQASFDGYSDQAGQQQSAVQGGGSGGGGGDSAGVAADSAAPVAATDTGATTQADSGSLPFTGLDVGLLVGASAVLILAGVGMRRLTRAPGSA